VVEKGAARPEDAVAVTTNGDFTRVRFANAPNVIPQLRPSSPVFGVTMPTETDNIELVPTRPTPIHPVSARGKIRGLPG
jgi:hypothetical protein